MTFKMWTDENCRNNDFAKSIGQNFCQNCYPKYLSISFKWTGKFSSVSIIKYLCRYPLICNKKKKVKVLQEGEILQIKFVEC